MSVYIQLYGRNTGSNSGQHAQCSKLKPRVSTEASMMDFCRQWPAATSRSVLLDQGMSALVTTVHRCHNRLTDSKMPSAGEERPGSRLCARLHAVVSIPRGLLGDAPQQGFCV